MSDHIYDATDNKWITSSDDDGCLPSSERARTAVSPVVRATYQSRPAMPNCHRTVRVPSDRLDRLAGRTSSSMPEDAGAAADLWQLPPSKRKTDPQVLRFPFSSASSARAIPCQDGTPARTPLDTALDVVTTIAGLLMFGMLAMFVWILA